LLSVVTALLALGFTGCGKAPERAAAPPPAPALSNVDQALNAMFAESGATGMVVAIVRGDQVTIRGFGRRAPDDPAPPDGATLVRLQSVSKLLAADVLVSLAAQGRLTLTDPLQKYAPAGRRVPQAPGARPLELLDLATHTSGLGRNSPADPAMPVPQAAAARWAWLQGRRLPPPGSYAHYSNLAFDLLGDAMAAAAHEPYVAALAQFVTGPLGMVDTTASPSPGQCRRLLSPGPLTAETPCQDTTQAAASGGLYSTAADMGAWIKHQLAAGGAAPDARAGQTVYYRRDALAFAEGLDVAGPATGIGLAWIQLDPTATHPRLLEKTGGGGGFMTYVALAPDRRVGMFVAINSVGFRRIQALSARTNDLVGALAAAP
jgi:D-alanyl-D-alanine-carboxypeptidase/D-alanyl-D-alanine-endopeptidase